jgi:NADH:ubiquinone oxidoreductase subunit F (NADH-binding)
MCIKSYYFCPFPTISSRITAYIYIRGEFYNEASNLQLAIKRGIKSIYRKKHCINIKNYFFCNMVDFMLMGACIYVY